MSEHVKKLKLIRRIEFMLIDTLAIFLTYGMAIFAFRVWGMTIPAENTLLFLPSVIIIHLFVFSIFGFYRMLVEYVGFEDVIKISAVIIGINIVLAIIFGISNMEFIPKLTYIFIAPLEIAFITAPRIAPRILKFVKTNIDWNKALGKRTLIVGAGAGGEMVVKEIYRNKSLNNIPVAFIDDDEKKIGSRVSGIRIFGPIKNINEIMSELNIEEVIIAIADIELKTLQRIIECVSKRSVKIKRLPLMAEMQAGLKPKIIDVKVEDLLNREVIHLDNQGIQSFISDEVVLITGGGGSIGSELARQVATHNPKQLVIFDIYENNAYEIQQELLRHASKDHKQLNLKVLIGSVYNLERLTEVFEQVKPTIVLHAAAYKHVPLMEDSPIEAIRTNVIGTYNTAKLADQYKVKKFVLVSSDKAVRPTNTMGATKRYAELIIQKMNKISQTTKYSAVRFGNVLGSNGSVIPLFKKQIEEGGPVTVTHKEITRYFMTIPEAVGLILQSAVYAKGGEIFILDMGEPVKVIHLAEKMISLAGFKPYQDIEIEFTGLRPGEKLYEELLIDLNDLDHEHTDNQKIFIEGTRHSQDINLDLEALEETLERKSNLEIKKWISNTILTYTITE